MNDSGVRCSYDSGAIREPPTNKGRYDLLSPIALCDMLTSLNEDMSPIQRPIDMDELGSGLQRLALVLEKGAEKYPERNWEEGIPIHRCFDSAFRHYIQAMGGMRDEDHLGLCAANIMFMLHLMAKINTGDLPVSLLTLPKTGGQKYLDYRYETIEGVDALVVKELALFLHSISDANTSQRILSRLFVLVLWRMGI